MILVITADYDYDLKGVYEFDGSLGDYHDRQQEWANDPTANRPMLRKDGQPYKSGATYRISFFQWLVEYGLVKQVEWVSVNEVGFVNKVGELLKEKPQSIDDEWATGTALNAKGQTIPDEWLEAARKNTRRLTGKDSL